MHIRPITNEKDWNDFVLSLHPNTFLQSYEWGQLQKSLGEGVRYLGFFDGDTQIGATMLLTVNARRGRHWFTPHGPLFIQEKDFKEGIETLLGYLKETASDENAVALRIAPLLINNEDNRTLFKSLGFKPAPLHVHTELTWMLDITQNDDQLLRGMRKTSRHAIKKATEAGVRVEILTSDDGLDRFMPLYSQTTERHGFVPFGEKYLKEQMRLFSDNDRAYVVIAKHEDNDVAGALLMQFGGTVFYHHGASLKLSGNVPAAHLLQWQSILEAKKRGATHYNFWGIAPEDKPNHPFTGITVFKKGFGGYAIDYMHAQDLPLSPKYWVLWAVDQYRKLRRGF